MKRDERNCLYLFCPAFKAAKKIEENWEFFQDLNRNLDSRKWKLRLLILNDGETADSLLDKAVRDQAILNREILDRLAAENDFLEVRHNKTNLGNAANVRAGYQWALSLANPETDLIACQDADSEHDPISLPRQMKKILLGKCDGIIGTIVYPDHAVGYLDRHMMRHLAFSQSQMMGLTENITYIQSSGYNIHKPALLQKVFFELLPKYEEYYRANIGEWPSWGFHAVYQTLLYVAGARLDVAYLACLGKSPNRTPEKADLQAAAALSHNNALRKFIAQLKGPTFRR